MIIGFSEFEKVCCNCKYFNQHYIKVIDGHVYQQFVPCNDGHCCYSGVKAKKAGAEACRNFKQKEISEE